MEGMERFTLPRLSVIILLPASSSGVSCSIHFFVVIKFSFLIRCSQCEGTFFMQVMNCVYGCRKNKAALALIKPPPGFMFITCVSVQACISLWYVCVLFADLSSPSFGCCLDSLGGLSLFQPGTHTHCLALLLWQRPDTRVQVLYISYIDVLQNKTKNSCTLFWRHQS